jgi:hypothetical protein
MRCPRATDTRKPDHQLLWTKPIERRWLTPVILATQWAEIRITTQVNSSRDPFSKKPITKKGLVEWFKV